MTLSTAVAPIPPQAILKPCTDPVIGDIKTDTDLGLGLLTLAQAYADCRELNREKAEYIKGTGGK